MRSVKTKLTSAVHMDQISASTTPPGQLYNVQSSVCFVNVSIVRSYWCAENSGGSKTGVPEKYNSFIIEICQKMLEYIVLFRQSVVGFGGIPPPLASPCTH